MLHGVDSVASSAAEWRQIVEGQPDAVGAYVNGRFANAAAAREAFPHAILYLYDVSGAVPGADVLDIEQSDATPQDAPDWARKHNGSGRKVLPHPGLYGSASIVAQIISVMLDAGIRRNEFLILSAHYGHGQHICAPDTCGFPQADGTQWADKGLHGQNTDLLLFGDHFFGAVKPPDPDARYGWFDGRRRALIGGLSERAVVREYDRWRGTQTRTSHPHRPRLAVLRGFLGVLELRLRAVIRLRGDKTDRRAWRLRELHDRRLGMRLV